MRMIGPLKGGDLSLLVRLLDFIQDMFSNLPTIILGISLVLFAIVLRHFIKLDLFSGKPVSVGGGQLLLIIVMSMIIGALIANRFLINNY